MTKKRDSFALSFKLNSFFFCDVSRSGIRVDFLCVVGGVRVSYCNLPDTSLGVSRMMNKKQSRRHVVQVTFLVDCAVFVFARRPSTVGERCDLYSQVSRARHSSWLAVAAPRCGDHDEETREESSGQFSCDTATDCAVQPRPEGVSDSRASLHPAWAQRPRARQRQWCHCCQGLRELGDVVFETFAGPTSVLDSSSVAASQSPGGASTSNPAPVPVV